jgi:hypothetical protein
MGTQIHTSSAASAIMTVNNPATANTTSQPIFIAGTAALTVLVTAERKTRASGACICVPRPTKLAIVGASPPRTSRPLGVAHESQANRGVDSRSGWAGVPVMAIDKVALRPGYCGERNATVSACVPSAGGFNNSALTLS